VALATGHASVEESRAVAANSWLSPSSVDSVYVLVDSSHTSSGWVAWVRGQSYLRKENEYACECTSTSHPG
jgi:hypothetical protein